MAAALAMRWDRRCDMTCVSQEALRHSLSVAAPPYATHVECRTQTLRHAGHVAAIHRVCRTKALRHSDRAVSGSLSAQRGAGSSRSGQRTCQLRH